MDDLLQIANVGKVMQTIGADVFAVQEVSDDDAVVELKNLLTGYETILANRWSYSFNPPDPNFPPQKIGFVYNTSTMQLVSSRVMFAKLYDDIREGIVTLPNYPTGSSSSFWSSGRLPFIATFDVAIQGTTKRIHMINIHAKSGSAPADYNRRLYDVNVLYDSLTTHYGDDNIILIGDLNDDVDTSIRSGFESTYKMFVDDDVNFKTLTYSLSVGGGASFPSSGSFLDHIIISNELFSSYIESSTAIEDPRTYIPNYVSNTSDHLPVSARFLLTKTDQEIMFVAIPDKTIGDEPFILNASASSNLPVTFSSTSENISISGSNVTLAGAGLVTIVASQVGDENYNAAPDAERVFCVNPAKPSVTMAQIGTGAPTLASSSTTGNQWYFNGTLIAGATSFAYQPTMEGVFSVQVTIGGCGSEFSDDAVVVITSINSREHKLTIHPNPVNDELIIEGLAPETTSGILIDMTGRTSLINFERADKFHRAEVRSFPSGLYVLKIVQEKTLKQIKFIKR